MIVALFWVSLPTLDHALRKCVFGYMRTAKARIRYPQTESLDAIACFS